MGHPIESDHPLPVCRHFSSQRPAPAILCDTQEAVTRLVTLNTHPISNLGYSNIQNTNNATNTLYSHEKTSRSRNVNIPTFTGNSNDSWKVWFSRFSTVAERAHVHKQMLVKLCFQQIQASWLLSLLVLVLDLVMLAALQYNTDGYYKSIFYCLISDFGTTYYFLHGTFSRKIRCFKTACRSFQR